MGILAVIVVAADTVQWRRVSVQWAQSRPDLPMARRVLDVGTQAVGTVTRTNGELLKSALDALDELVRRGNKSLETAQRDVQYHYEDYLALKSRAATLESLDDADDELDPACICRAGFGMNLSCPAHRR